MWRNDFAIDASTLLLVCFQITGAVLSGPSASIRFEKAEIEPQTTTAPTVVRKALKCLVQKLLSFKCIFC